MDGKRLLPALVLVALVAGCGGSKGAAPASTSSATATTTTTTSAATPATTTSSSAGALQAEATASATGDVPDNQVFLRYRNPAAGYSIKYPEGWALSGAGGKVTIRDKNNIVRIVVARRPKPTAAAIRRELRGVRLKSGPEQVTIGGSPAYKVVYTSRSAPNPVTGKRVTLVVDRYYIFRGGREAIVDLGTPEGVDNVDAYRLMIESFRWR